MEIEELTGTLLQKEDLTFSAILGSVQYVKCVADSPSKWFNGPRGLVLKEPFAYPKPIPCDGQLGLFERPELARTIARYEKLREAKTR